jgi:cell fate regulator YaaT (PSP1 superfamily)
MAQAQTEQPFVVSTEALVHARAEARRRFKSRIEQGETVGQCECHDEPSASVEEVNSGNAQDGVIGVRFLDSGQVYFFQNNGAEIQLDDWVVVETARGREAARVVIAPHQLRLNQLRGDLKPIERRLSQTDVEKMQRLKKDSAKAVRTFSAKIREYELPMKPISAEYNFDGSQIVLNFSAPDRVDFRALARDLASTFRCRVELRQVGARDEARLLGGVGRCGRTLCCASWLPVFPEISMGMAKTQDLSLNPSKVSGVCGRLLCCLSYENDQYRQMKAVMPKLGQKIETPRGAGQVVALQILKNLVSVRLTDEGVEANFPAHELGFGSPPEQPVVRTLDVSSIAHPSDLGEDDTAPAEASGDPEAADEPLDDGEAKGSGRRRRRRRRSGRGQGSQAEQSAG